MSRHAQRFWNETERYHDLAQQIDENVEITYPDATTSDRLCPWCYHCIWAKTNVTYWEYSGPSIHEGKPQ